MLDLTELCSAHLLVIAWFVQPRDAFSKLLHKICVRELVRRGRVSLAEDGSVDEWILYPYGQDQILVEDFDTQAPESLEDGFFEHVLGRSNPWAEKWYMEGIEDIQNGLAKDKEDEEKGDPDKATPDSTE